METIYDTLTETNLRGGRCPTCGGSIHIASPHCDNCGEYYEPACVVEGRDERFNRGVGQKRGGEINTCVRCLKKLTEEEKTRYPLDLCHKCTRDKEPANGT